MFSYSLDPFIESLSDPTAGQSAQLRRLQPEVPQPILDPTDPRYGAPDKVSESGIAAAETRRKPVEGPRLV